MSSGTMPMKFYNYLGFQRGYNFVLWFVFSVAMIGFPLARVRSLNFDGYYCPSESHANGDGAAPGECYYYRTFSSSKIGILLHLSGILPASVISVIQFTPFVRQKWMVAHRIGGYVAMVLYVISLVGVLMIARHAFGGSIDVQAWCGFMGLGILSCFGLSLYNIKKLQIEQHRAWMLRGWSYAGSIITSRLILILSALITSNRGYYIVWTCAKIFSTYSKRSVKTLVQDYPSCASWADGSNPEQVAPVSATFEGGLSANIGAALDMSFGASVWLAFNIHALGVEIYLALTPREAERLRKVSYARQLEAGMQNPGSAGLTTDRLGDSEKWTVPKRKASLDSANAALVQPSGVKQDLRIGRREVLIPDS